jgi:transposase
MAQRPRVLRGQRKIIGAFEQINPNAAGIDAGSEKHWVSVPEDRDGEPVKSFETFTEDLYRMAEWLVECGITTVAIEATGVYWIPLVEVLESRGIDVNLVDSRSIGGRSKKTDVLDCQWLRQLHTFGLLNAAFRPKADVLPLRAYQRQRQMLIRYAADHIRHMQKALDLMNLKLHVVINDITGKTGLQIIRAILAGERDPVKLASLRDPKCKNSEQTIAKALFGNYREEHLFELRQAYDLFSFYQAQIAACDERTEQALKVFDRKAAPGKVPTKKASPSRKRRKNQPYFDGRTLLQEMVGVDLPAIDGIEVSTGLTIVSETGIDLDKFKTSSHYVSWLRLAPNNRVTGGKRLRQRGPKIHPNRATQAYLLAAQSLARAKNWLGAFFRRIQSRHGFAVAVKATAAKLARIVYAMIKNKTDYDAPDVNYYEQRYRSNLVKSLERRAQLLGFTLVPADAVH